jgi:phytoene dehydrogenase-like protein
VSGAAPLSSTSYDALIVGSGINSLVAGAYLAKGGWRVGVFERNDWLGGAIRTAELTAPGYWHDVFSSWHPLFASSQAYVDLGDDLRSRGLEYLRSEELAAATLFADGRSVFLAPSNDANIVEMGRHAPGDADAWRAMVADFMQTADLAFGVLGTDLRSRDALNLGFMASRRLGRSGLVAFAGRALASARDWLDATFESDEVKGLLAPWVLHTGIGPDAASGAFMTQVIAVALEMTGMPLPRGGGGRLADALVSVIRDHGGTCATRREVEAIVVRDGTARGLRFTDGETIEAHRAIVCNVTPQQLYDRLLAGVDIPKPARKAARSYRYGRGNMQIHLALDSPPDWRGDPRLSRTPVIHICDGLNGVSRAVNEADRGLLPAEGTIVCGQPTAIDPSRAPAGGAILWIQLQELPRRPVGDAAGELQTAGAWTPELRERYADRIQARLARHIKNLDETVVARAVLSPTDLAAANPNLVGGDIYSGALTLDQNFLWRPSGQLPGHRTPIRRLYHIGASTYPGPGLGGGSGTMVAKQLLRRSLISSLTGLARRGRWPVVR